MPSGCLRAIGKARVVLRNATHTTHTSGNRHFSRSIRGAAHAARRGFHAEVERKTQVFRRSSQSRSFLYPIISMIGKASATARPADFAVTPMRGRSLPLSSDSYPSKEVLSALSCEASKNPPTASWWRNPKLPRFQETKLSEMKTKQSQINSKRALWRIFRRSSRRHDPMLVLNMTLFNFTDGWNRAFSREQYARFSV